MRRKHSVGYFSSYDRGLECLLDMWPKIREQVPDATLDVYYGWAGFDSVWRSNPKMMKWRWLMTKKLYDLKSQGVTEHGRVDHETLAKAMKAIQVWAYPTEFTEINCITALKAQEAGCIPVVTDVAALQETVREGSKLYPGPIYSDQVLQAKFVEAVVRQLDNESPSSPVPGVGWDEIANQWNQVCASEPSQSPTTNHA